MGVSAMSRATVIAERYQLLDTYLSTNGHGHTTVDAYPGNEVMAAAVAYWRTGEAKYLTHCQNQWAYVKSFRNGAGIIVLPTWSPDIARDPVGRTAYTCIYAARLLRAMGQTALADEIISVIDAQATFLIDHEATYCQSFSSEPPYSGFTASIYAAVMSPTEYTGSGCTLDANQNAEVALMFAMLYNEPTSSFFTAGAYRTKALTHLDAEAGMVLAYQQADGRVPIGTGYLTTYDTVYGRYSAAIMAMVYKEMGPGWSNSAATYTYCQRALAWINAYFSTEPNLGGNYYYGHVTGAGEPLYTEPVADLLGLSHAVGDLPFTDGKFIDPYTRFVLTNYTPAGNGTQSVYFEQYESIYVNFTQLANVYLAELLTATPVDDHIALTFPATTGNLERRAV